MRPIPKWLVWAMAVAATVLLLGTVVNVAVGDESVIQLVLAALLLACAGATVWQWKSTGRL